MHMDMAKPLITSHTQLLGHDFLPLNSPRSAEDPAQSLCFIFIGNALLLSQAEQGQSRLPRGYEWTEWAAQFIIESRLWLGYQGNQGCQAIALKPDHSDIPDGWALIPLRQSMQLLSRQYFGLAGRAYQMLQWEITHRFCGRCGHAMQHEAHERAKRCSQCGLVNYPRISPAVIMRITDGSRILLSRSPHFVSGMYSVQAGFVEAGETLEDAVIREVQEEVSLEIHNIQYFGSQPWPFPNSLMLAFTAEYAGGELRIQEPELEDAQWFELDKLPRLPSSTSIAYSLIEDFRQQWAK